MGDTSCVRRAGNETCISLKSLTLFCQLPDVPIEVHTGQMGMTDLHIKRIQMWNKLTTCQECRFCKSTEQRLLSTHRDVCTKRQCKARRDSPPRSANATGSVAIQDSHRPVRPSTGSTAGLIKLSCRYETSM